MKVDDGSPTGSWWSAIAIAVGLGLGLVGGVLFGALDGWASGLKMALILGAAGWFIAGGVEAAILQRSRNGK